MRAGFSLGFNLEKGVAGIRRIFTAITAAARYTYPKPRIRVSTSLSAFATISCSACPATCLSSIQDHGCLSSSAVGVSVFFLGFLRERPAFHRSKPSNRNLVAAARSRLPFIATINSSFKVSVAIDERLSDTRERIRAKSRSTPQLLTHPQRHLQHL